MANYSSSPLRPTR